MQVGRLNQRVNAINKAHALLRVGTLLYRNDRGYRRASSEWSRDRMARSFLRRINERREYAGLEPVTMMELLVDLEEVLG